MEHFIVKFLNRMDYETYKQNRLSGLTPEESYQQEGFSAGRMIGNIPKSAGQFLGGIAGAVVHPIETVKTLGKVAAGGVEKLIPGQQAEERYFNSLTDFYKQRYGSFDKFLQSLENDPVGVISDASIVLTSGGALVAKIGTISKAGQITSKIGNIINPLTPVGKLTSETKMLFPKIAQQLEKSNLRLTKIKEGAILTEKMGNDAMKVLTKNRLNEITEFLSKQKIIGNPLKRFAKATNVYQKTEDILDNFFSSFSKGSIVKKSEVVKALHSLKAIYKGHRDYPTIQNQINGAIKSISNLGDEIKYGQLNKFKRTTYQNAYNKAGEKVIDSVEHSIGDVIRGMMDEKLRGLKIAGKTFEEFNNNYGLLIESRKLLKSAIGKPEISRITERIMGGTLGYLIGSAAGSPGLGAFGGLAIGQTLFEQLPMTKIKSIIGAGAAKIGETKLPEVISKTKIPLTGIERIRESQK